MAKKRSTSPFNEGVRQALEESWQQVRLEVRFSLFKFPSTNSRSDREIGPILATELLWAERRKAADATSRVSTPVHRQPHLFSSFLDLS
jgi:hypothetical protein